jgi:hypothetical protein
MINKINIKKHRKGNIVNSHKIGRGDIHGKEHEDCNYSSGKSPTCWTDAESSVYNHNDCEEHPTQMLLHLTPEKPESSHASLPDPSELTPTPPESLSSSPALCQSSSPSDLLPFSSSELPDSELTSSKGGIMSDSDSVLAVELDDPVEFIDRGKGVLQCAANVEPCSNPPTGDERDLPLLQK